MTNGEITLNTDQKITTIEFYHPKGNSLPGTLLKGLAEAITKTGSDPESNVIILRSRGEKAFCAGASFDELLSINDFETGKRFFMGFANVINAIRTCPKFVVTRIQGKVVGGGVGLAAASDYVLAHETASLKLSELALGIGPFVVGPAVERKTGTGAFSTLSIDADWRNALWAKKHNIYKDIFETHEALDESVQKLAARLATFSPEAMKAMKKILWEGTEHWDSLLEKRAEISGKLVLSKHTRKKIQEFKNA